MSRVILLLLMIAFMAMCGCAESAALIKTNRTSVRSDIFEELKNGGQASPSLADLHIIATLKTHRPGIYSAKDIHGTADYKLLLNIDGQAVLLSPRSLQLENSEPMGLMDPEAGDGIRYRFDKRVRLKAGMHKIIVALPEEGIAVEREVELDEGKTNDLVLEPVYGMTARKRVPASYGTTSFKEGIKGIRLTLNGRKI